jgi:hypothetical protein
MRFRRTCTVVRAPQFSSVGPSAYAPEQDQLPSRNRPMSPHAETAGQLQKEVVGDGARGSRVSCAPTGVARQARTIATPVVIAREDIWLPCVRDVRTDPQRRRNEQASLEPCADRTQELAEGFQRSPNGNWHRGFHFTGMGANSNGDAVVQVACFSPRVP